MTVLLVDFPDKSEVYGNTPECRMRAMQSYFLCESRSLGLLIMERIGILQADQSSTEEKWLHTLKKSGPLLSNYFVMCLLTNCQEGKLADFTFMTIIFCILSSDEQCGSESDEGKGLLERIYGHRARIFLTKQMWKVEWIRRKKSSQCIKQRELLLQVGFE